MSDEQKSWKPEPPYVTHSEAMLTSPAWRALDPNTKKFLERLEIEHMRHGGKDNGKLPCTYENLADFGIRREVIPRCIRRATVSGFARQTRRGYRSRRGARASLFLLTYLPTYNADRNRWIQPTDDWKHYRPNRKTNGSANEKCAPKSSTESGTQSGTETGTQPVPKAVLNVQKSPKNLLVPNPVHLSRTSSHSIGPAAEAVVTDPPAGKMFGLGQNRGQTCDTAWQWGPTAGSSIH